MILASFKIAIKDYILAYPTLYNAHRLLFQSNTKVQKTLSL